MLKIYFQGETRFRGMTNGHPPDVINPSSLSTLNMLFLNTLL